MADELGRRAFIKRAGATGAAGWTMLGVVPLAQTAQGCEGESDPPPTTLPPTPVLQGTHLGAAAQATEFGRRLQDLCIFDGRVFAGYGDWSANTGPIAVHAWNIADSTWEVEGSLDTECTWSSRRLGDRLVVPFIDPRSNTGDVAVRSLGSSTWTTLAIGAGTAGTVHCFDAATLDGTDLWVCGAKHGTRDGAVWHSPSGAGGDWVESLVVPSVDDRWTRCLMLVAQDGVLWTGGYSYNNAQPYDPQNFEAQSFDGSAWTPAPAFSFDAGTATTRSGHQPHTFDGGVVRQRSWPATYSATEVLWFDGADLTVGPELVFDLTVDERGWLWMLDDTGAIIGKVSWDAAPFVAAQAPAGASCLAVDGTDVYVGTTASELYRTTFG